MAVASISSSPAAAAGVSDQQQQLQQCSGQDAEVELLTSQLVQQHSVSAGLRAQMAQVTAENGSLWAYIQLMEEEIAAHRAANSRPEEEQQQEEVAYQFVEA